MDTTLITEMRSLIESTSAPLDEKASTHHPFKNKKKLGPGPGGRTMSKANQWACKCPTAYKCTCTGKGAMKGQTKKIKINKQVKSKYNAKYRKWVKKNTKAKKAAEKAKAKAKK